MDTSLEGAGQAKEGLVICRGIFTGPDGVKGTLGLIQILY